MTAQQLKASILQLAIQGKLVPQNPADEPASMLLKRIKAEKDALVKAGKLKKDKHESVIIRNEDGRFLEKKDGKTTDITDEIPFDISPSWTWIRLNGLGLYKKGPFGSSITKSMFVPKGENTYKVYEQKNAIRKNVSDGTYYISEEKFKELSGFEVFPGEIIVSCAGTIGEAYVMPEEMPRGIINQALMKIRLFSSDIIDFYLLYFDHILKSSAKQTGKGTAIKNIPPFDYLKKMLFPLPPLAEQKRIVAKIEELLPHVEEYGKAETELSKLNVEFPDMLKKSILQWAIQGRLVPQDPTDEPASELLKRIHAEKASLIKSGKLKKEKPLPPISEDEIPFDIPESWEWTRLAQVFDVRDGTHDTPKYVTGCDGIPLVTSKNLSGGKIDFSTTKLISFEDAQKINMRSAVDDLDILFAMIGTIGNPVLVKKDREFCIKNMALFKGIVRDVFCMEYLFFFLEKEQSEMKKQTSSGVQSFVSLNFLRNYLFPLPPLAEQKRITKKLETILSIIHRFCLK